MTQPALAKTSPPRLFGVVARDRLYGILDDNLGRPLIWIVSPPGAGKTTLAAGYLEARGLCCLWYHVDGDDADPAVLFQHLHEAARYWRDAGSASPLPRFQPEHGADVAAFARLFFRSLFRDTPPGWVLVFDNFQDAPADSHLKTVVRECVRQTPPGHSVFVLSRADPPVDFVQFTARAEMMTIAWDRMRMSIDESMVLCRKRGVSEGWLVQALHRQSQGWAAGMTLMLERLRHVDGTAGSLPGGTRESVFDYFASLMFDQAPPAHRHILRSVALLPHVTESLAVELSGDREAPALLDALYRRSLFTDRRPGTERTYQFHALFVEFLADRAHQELTAPDYDDLVRRSALALELRHSTEAAVSLWLAHACWTEARRLILAEARRALGNGRRLTLARWIESLPTEMVASDPWLLHWLGCSILQTDPEAGTPILEQALVRFRALGDSGGSLECITTLVGGTFLGFHAIASMDHWVDELLAEIERAPGFDSHDGELRVCGVLCVALLHARPWHPRLLSAYRRVDALLCGAVDLSIALGAAMGAVVVSGLTGDFKRGDRIAAIVSDLASRDAASPSEAAWGMAQIAYLRLMQARYDDALEALADAEQIARAHALGFVLRSILQWKCLMAWRAGQLALASAALAEVERMSPSAHSMHQAMGSLLKVRLSRTHEDSRNVVRCIESTLANVARTASRLEELVFAISCSDVLLDAGCPERAVPLLDRAAELIEIAPAYDCFRGAVALLKAGSLHGVTHWAQTEVALRDALRLTGEGNRRFYLRFADWTMAKMFEVALDAGIEVELVRQIIGLMRLHAPPNASRVWPWPIRIFTLGRFDVQVNGRSLTFPRKTPRKTLLLLKAIVAHGARGVTEQALCDALWSDEEGDTAANALSITVLRLRKLLGIGEAIVLRGGVVSLDPSVVWIDADAFERDAGKGSAAVTDMLDLYRGDFLAEEAGESWSVPARERLRGRFIDVLSRLGAGLESAGDIEHAVRCYLRGVEADPVVEAFHVGLMRCYEALGRRTEAISAYRRMKQILSVVLGVPPSESAHRLYLDLLERQLAQGAQPPADGTGDVVALPVGARRPAR